MRYLGDPDHQTVDLERLLDPRRLRRRRASIALDRTHTMPRFGLEEAGTHHLVTADGGGNFVSLTTTVNRVFGTKLTAGDSGVILNDELDDFTAKKQVAPFGMKESPNRPRPRARPVSSMTPTIVVQNGRAILALGGSGGTAIATNVAQITLAHLVFGAKADDAVAAARFYVPTRHATIWLEKGADASLVEDLEGRGEIVGTTPFTKSAIQLIAVQQGFKVPAADPRKHGSALAR
jgi:gamma-glutamyltranspeptidase/glutathione hydrolase